VHETNTYAEQKKIQSASNIPFRFRMRNRKPVTTDEMNVVLALFILMGIIQKTTLRLYFQTILFWQLLSLAVLFLWTGLNQSAITCISVTVRV
jgi:hypothetical protein